MRKEIGVEVLKNYSPVFLLDGYRGRIRPVIQIFDVVSGKWIIRFTAKCGSVIKNTKNIKQKSQ